MAIMRDSFTTYLSCVGLLFALKGIASRHREALNFKVLKGSFLSANQERGCTPVDQLDSGSEMPV